MSLAGGSLLIRDEPERSPEVDACVIILEWGLLTSEHTDIGLRMKGAFSHGVVTSNSLIKDEPE